MNVVLSLLDPRLPQASTFAPAVDRSLQFVAWFVVFLGVVTAGGLLALVILRRDGADESGSSTKSVRRIAQWVGSTTFVILAAFFAQGAFAWADMQVIPRGALPIKVATTEGAFAFTYPNGYVAKELHLPRDRAVKFTFRGEREPYGFTIQAFRLQVGVDAFASATAWVQPTLAGEYEARSTLRPRSSAIELLATVVVHDEAAYDKWYADISGPPLDLPPIELGQRSYQMRGCTQCHTIDGSKLVGPSFKGFLAREHKLKDGTVIAPTDAYIAESILDPQAKVIEGFEPVMPSFKGRLHELEVAGLVAYVKSLQ